MRFVFVGGASAPETRSLQRILGSHPEICAVPEFRHLPDVVDLRRRLYGSIDRGWIDLICSREDVDERLRTLLEGLLLPMATRKDCRLLSDGTPENVTVFAELAQLFPEARLVHVVRDPRATIASELDAGDRAQRPFRGALQRWKDLEAAIRRVEAALEAGFRAAREAHDRVLNLPYEDLCGDPERALRRLCGFLGVDWEPSMIGPPEPGPPSRLSPGQRVAIAKAFGGNHDLAELGYDVSPGSLASGVRLRGSLTRSIGRSACELERLALRALRKLSSAARRRTRSTQAG